MIFKKLKEINLIVLTTLVLVVLASTVIFLEKTSLKDSPIPTSQEEITPKVEKPLPPVEFVVQNHLQVTPTEPFVLEIIPTDKLSALVYRLEVLFDPKVLLVEKITVGDFFKNPKILREEVNNESGYVFFSAGITPEEIAAAGEPKNKNSLASLIFKTKLLNDQQENVETVISFGEKTLIVSEESKFENLNQTLKPITIIITGK